MKKKSLNAKKIILKYLNNRQILKIYKEFEESLDTKERYAVGLSGGPDSLALAFLSKCFSIITNTHFKNFIFQYLYY